MSKEEDLLEKFIFDEDLKVLEEKYELNKFNIFDCLKLTRAEIRHSNFLAWLLDPNETHGFNDYFLKKFLKLVISNKKSELQIIKSNNPHKFIDIDDENHQFIENYRFPSIFDVDGWDLSKVQIKREKEYIDILAIDETNKFVFIIENKIDTSQHDNQLTRYRQYIDEQYQDDYKKLFIYLKPTKEEVEEPYIYVGYDTIRDAINELLNEKLDKINGEIITIITHYKKTIERDIMQNDELAQICKQIYKQHKTAIDLINKYRESTKDEIYEILKSIIENDENLCLRPSNSDWIRFIPKEAEYPSLNIAIEDWVSSNNLLIFEINNKKNSVDIDIVIRRVDENKAKERQNLLDLAQKKFNYRKGRKKDSYDHIKSIPLINENDYDDVIQKSDSALYDYLKTKIEESGIIPDFIELATAFNNIK